jgi:RNA polymerase sigma-70 factor (ECF subfamily)
MNEHLENTFLTAVEHNQQKLLRVCSVYAEDANDKKDLFPDFATLFQVIFYYIEY